MLRPHPARYQRGGFCIHSAVHMGNAKRRCASCTPTRKRRSRSPTIAMGSCLSASTRSGSMEKWAIWTTAAHSKPQRSGLRFPGRSATGTCSGCGITGRWWWRRVHRGVFFAHVLPGARLPDAGGDAVSMRRSATEIVMPDEEHCRAMARAFENGDAVINREWNALVRMIKTISPGFDEVDGGHSSRVSDRRQEWLSREVAPQVLSRS